MELVFKREQEYFGFDADTVRFVEQATDQPPVIGTIYIQKWAMELLGDPDTLKITVEG
jgi:hypothetical protein